MQRFNYPDTSEAVITTRKYASSYLLVDSRDRYLLVGGRYVDDIETSPNNILINNQKSLGTGAIKRVALTELSFPWCTPNVNKNNNNFTLTNVTTGDIYEIEIDEDFYTGEELASELQATLNQETGHTQTPLFSVTYSTSGKYFIFSTNSTVSTDTWDFTEPESNQFEKKDFLQFINTGNFLLTPDNTAGPYRFVGGYTSLHYTRYIDICSSTLTKFQNIKDSLSQLNYSDQVYRLFIEDPTQANTITKQIILPKFMEWNENQYITSIDFQLRDEDGELLYIPQDAYNADYYLSFIMSES